LDFLKISPQALHRHLVSLVDDGVLEKKGLPPHVFYNLRQDSKPLGLPIETLSPEVLKFLDDHYVYIDPQGSIHPGFKGFILWADKTQQIKKLKDLIPEYISVRQAANGHFDKNLGLVLADQKFKTTFPQCVLEHIYYLDFYSLPKFGKTKLGSLVLYGKQSQNKKEIKKLADLSQYHLLRLVAYHQIDAVVWTPHSLPRKVPFLKELKKHLKISCAELQFIKAYQGILPIAQKSLSKFSERIENAQMTIHPAFSTVPYQNILIIDDAVGSGATMDSISQKIKLMNPKAKIFGFAFVGSLKGFEVIQEI